MRKNHYSNTIPSQRWYDHFSSLLNTGNDLNDKYEKKSLLRYNPLSEVVLVRTLREQNIVPWT